MDFTIPLQLQSNTPIYLQIYDYIKAEIIQGSISVGTRLPSHRNLASQLNISRITVESAYQQLLAEGYVESKPKRGIFVANFDIDVIPNKKRNAAKKTNNLIDEQFEYDCSQGLIDQNAFPITNWKRALQESILTYENALFAKEDPQGEFALREHISTYLYHSRGVHSSPDQIVIGAGTQLSAAPASTEPMNQKERRLKTLSKRLPLISTSAQATAGRSATTLARPKNCMKMSAKAAPV